MIFPSTRSKFVCSLELLIFQGVAHTQINLLIGFHQIALKWNGSLTKLIQSTWIGFKQCNLVNCINMQRKLSKACVSCSDMQGYEIIFSPQSETEEVVPFSLDDTFNYNNVVLSHKYPVKLSNCGSSWLVSAHTWIEFGSNVTAP